MEVPLTGGYTAQQFASIRHAARRRREERKEAMTHCANTLPRIASRDPIGFALEAHARRTATHCSWQWQDPPDRSVDPVLFITTVFRHCLRPTEISTLMRTAAIKEDSGSRRKEKEEAVKAKKTTPSAVLLPRRHFLLPTRLHLQPNSCSQCRRQHVLPRITRQTSHRTSLKSKASSRLLISNPRPT